MDVHTCASYRRVVAKPGRRLHTSYDLAAAVLGGKLCESKYSNPGTLLVCVVLLKSMLACMQLLRSVCSHLIYVSPWSFETRMHYFSSFYCLTQLAVCRLEARLSSIMSQKPENFSAPGQNPDPPGNVSTPVAQHRRLYPLYLVMMLCKPVLN